MIDQNEIAGLAKEQVAGSAIGIGYPLVEGDGGVKSRPSAELGEQNLVVLHRAGLFHRLSAEAKPFLASERGVLKQDDRWTEDRKAAGRGDKRADDLACELVAW